MERDCVLNDGILGTWQGEIGGWIWGTDTYQVDILDYSDYQVAVSCTKNERRETYELSGTMQLSFYPDDVYPSWAKLHLSWVDPPSAALNGLRIAVKPSSLKWCNSLSTADYEAPSLEKR